MPIEVISTKYTTTEFPKLMIYSTKDGYTIVLMLDKYGKGNGIATTSNTWLNNMDFFYKTSNDWKIEDFVDFNETLTIKNK
jgi:hypothetical protein